MTLNEEMAMGSRLSLSVQLEGAIPIKIPCLDIGGTNLGSWYIIFIRTVVCIFCSNQIVGKNPRIVPLVSVICIFPSIMFAVWGGGSVEESIIH